MHRIANPSRSVRLRPAPPTTRSAAALAASAARTAQAVDDALASRSRPLQAPLHCSGIFGAVRDELVGRTVGDEPGNHRPTESVATELGTDRAQENRRPPRAVGSDLGAGADEADFLAQPEAKIRKRLTLACDDAADQTQQQARVALVRQVRVGERSRQAPSWRSSKRNGTSRRRARLKASLVKAHACEAVGWRLGARAHAEGTSRSGRRLTLDRVSGPARMRHRARGQNTWSREMFSSQRSWTFQDLGARERTLRPRSPDLASAGAFLLARETPQTPMASKTSAWLQTQGSLRSCGRIPHFNRPATFRCALIPVLSNLAATVPATRARVAKLVDAAGLKPVAGQLAGSNPAPGTTKQRHLRRGALDCDKDNTA